MPVVLRTGTSPLTETQKASNKDTSSIRIRVEHVFGFVENSMHGFIIRTVGIARANAKIGMMNLTYDICRCTELKIVVDMGTSTTNIETELTCNTAYTRYVWAYNACGNSAPVILAQSTSLDPPAPPTE